jgi:hypothetical protein
MPCSKEPLDTPVDGGQAKAGDELSPPLNRDAHAQNAARLSGTRPLPVSRRSKLTAPDLDRRARTPRPNASLASSASRERSLPTSLWLRLRQQTIEASMERQPPRRKPDAEMFDLAAIQPGISGPARRYWIIRTFDNDQFRDRAHATSWSGGAFPNFSDNRWRK